MKLMSDAQFVILYELELQQHKQDLHAKMIKTIDDYMRVAGREQYFKDLEKRQREHLDSVHGLNKGGWQPCMHDQCSECHGTGVRRFGGVCVHALSCPCPKCRVTC